MGQQKILLVSLPEKGHINPLIGIAQILQERNFDIYFFSQFDISPQLKKAGINCDCLTPQSPMKIPEDLIAHGADFAQKLKNKEWMQRWIKALLLDSVPPQVESLERIVQQLQPDIVVTDPMVYAACIVAETNNIPWAGISNSLNPLTPKDWSSDLIETLERYGKERLHPFQALNRTVEFRVADCISPWLNTVFSTEAYISRELGENNFSFYLGTPFRTDKKRGDETDFPFERLVTGKKKLYMSLGSMVYHHPILFKTVAEAVEDFNVQLILSVGSLNDEAFASNFPEDTIICSYVPQLQVLPYIDVVVSHGGANSVLESLYNGIPLALLPICNDQFFQARFIRKANAGVVLDAYKPEVAQYRRALKKLFSDDNSYRANAQKIQKSFADYGGAQEGADLIVELLENRAPLKPS